MSQLPKYFHKLFLEIIPTDSESGTPYIEPPVINTMVLIPSSNKITGFSLLTIRLVFTFDK